MFIEFIGIIFVGIVCVGIVMFVNIVLGCCLFKWIMFVVVGVGMIGMMIFNEYMWFDCIVENLFEGVVIVIKVDE